jgi:hypothetical protein
MRRFLPLLLAALVLTGCGSSQSGSGGGEGSAPAPADLAGDAVAALDEAGSAHYVVDASVQANGDAGFTGSLHAEGDASANAFTADGTVTFRGVTFSGQVLAGRDELFLNFMSQWYGDRHVGLWDTEEESPSADEVREYFDDVFTGSVSEGPELDGAATWRFEGKLNPDGFADLTERFEEEQMTEQQRKLLRALAEHTHFVLDVGQDDGLPRHLEFTVEVPKEALADLVGQFDGSAHATVNLSQFGKEVSYEAPPDFRPLEELFQGLFNGLE